MSERKDTSIETLAVALQYSGIGAPRVTAKGGGEIARRILQLADEHGIPLHEDPQLVAVLASVKLGAEIPPALYLSVAKVIAFAYLVSGKIAPPNSDD